MSGLGHRRPLHPGSEPADASPHVISLSIAPDALNIVQVLRDGNVEEREEGSLPVSLGHHKVPSNPKESSGSHPVSGATRLPSQEIKGKRIPHVPHQFWGQDPKIPDQNVTKQIVIQECVISFCPPCIAAAES